MTTSVRASCLLTTSLGVVDPKALKVYGTANLRVIDASIIPMLIATHPQSTVYAIAEMVTSPCCMIKPPLTQSIRRRQI